MGVNNEQRMVREFHQKYGCSSRTTPALPDVEMRLLRSRLIMEEATEFVTAASQKDMVEMVDALCDLLYVAYGAAEVMGVDLEPIFAEVQRSNMTKAGVGEDPAGKVGKGPTFQPPDVAAKLREQGWDGE